MCSIPSTPQSPAWMGLDGHRRETTGDLRFGAMLLAAAPLRGSGGSSARALRTASGDLPAIRGLVPLHSSAPGAARRGTDLREAYRDCGRLPLPAPPERLAGPVRRLTTPIPRYTTAWLTADAAR